MVETLSAGRERSSTRSRDGTATSTPDLAEWLQTGRLTLVDDQRRTLGWERWCELPPDVQANALDDFRRIVRSNTKAAVIFLRSSKAG